MKRNGNRELSAEDEMPLLAAAATRSAFRRALKLGHSVLITRNGGIYRAHSDGSFEFVKKSKPMVQMQEGTIIKIKCPAHEFRSGVKINHG